jgi:sentrin-specific protease 7
MSGKRRKTGPVITLDDDDDEVLEISRSDRNLPVGTSQDRPRSARSLYSQMSIGSESTTGDFKPSTITSEFREADNLLRPSQKKSRRSCSNTCKGGGGRASTSPGAHLARQVILQELQQGEAKQDPARHESRVDPVTSHFFPNARINESTSDQAGEKQRANVQSEYLRMQHKPAPKRAESIIDSYSADELAISPKQKERKLISKQRQAANSGAKRNTRDRALHDVWQLSFARSYDYDGSSSTLNNSHSALVLRNNLPDGWQVQIFDPIEDSYRTRFLINPKDVNKVLADDTGHIRLEGPRKPDGNSDVFDVGFVNLAEFLLFRDRYAASVTPTGKFHSKPE